MLRLIGVVDVFPRTYVIAPIGTLCAHKSGMNKENDMTTKIAYAPKIRRHVEMPSHYDPSIVSRCDLAHDAALTRVDPGDEVVAYDGDEGYIVSLDGDTITVAWDTGVTTTGPLDGIALV